MPPRSGKNDRTSLEKKMKNTKTDVLKTGAVNADTRLQEWISRFREIVP